MVIDHICFAVKNLEEGISYWQNTFGYNQMTEIITNTRQKVKVVFLTKADSILIKLIEPVDGNGSLTNFVNRGGGFHHLCFRCADLNDEIDRLSSRGMIKLVAPQPGEAFNNHNIAFLLGRYNMNVELIDTGEKAGLR